MGGRVVDFKVDRGVPPFGIKCGGRCFVERCVFEYKVSGMRTFTVFVEALLEAECGDVSENEHSGLADMRAESQERVGFGRLISMQKLVFDVDLIPVRLVT